MGKIPIALQLYTVRDDLAENPIQTIRSVSEMGYQGVEGGPPAGMSNIDFLELLTDHNLVLIGGGVSPVEMRNDIQKISDRCQELGIDTLMCGIGGELQQHNGDWIPVVEALAEGCAKAKEVGLRILYHNHAFEFENKVNGKYGLDYLFDTIPVSDIQAELDTYWVQKGGADPVEYIKKYAGRLPRLHIKDSVSDPENQDCPFAEVGHGILDWDNIFAVSPGAGVEWYVVEQDRCVRSPLESAKLSLDYLRSRGMI